MRALLFSLLCLTASAFAVSIPPDTEELLRAADAIAIVTVTTTKEVPCELKFGKEAIPWSGTEATVTVTDALKGNLPKTLTVTHPPHSACYHDLYPGEWLLFLKRGKSGFTVFYDPHPIKSGTIEWYTSNWRWPDNDEMRTIFEKNPDAHIAPEFAPQPVPKVSKHIRDILKSLKPKKSK